MYCCVFLIRRKKLEESLQYQQFCVGLDEEEAWLNEKTALVSNEEVGDTLAAIQGLLKKHQAFELDVEVHRGRVGESETAANNLISEV